jgi:hypothetical protein
MRRAAVIALVFAATIASNLLLDGHRAGAQPIPGATYTGTHSGGGAFSLKVSADGQYVESFEIAGHCPLFESLWLAVWAPIHNGSFVHEKPGIYFAGSFTSARTAEGIISFHDQDCPGTFAWSVAHGAAAPPVPPVLAPLPAVLQQQCSPSRPGKVLVVFSWQPVGGGSQWLDLSLFDNGFAPGTYVGVGPLPSGSSTFAWDGLLGGMTHYVRVNTLTATGWVPSRTLAFTTGLCGGPATLGQPTEACGEEPGTVAETFRWSASAPLGSVQWLDLSLVDNAFAPGSFLSAGPLDPAATSFTWRGLRSGLSHYWRVNTLTPTGWQPSSTGSFVTRSCPQPSSLGPISISYTSTRPPGSFTGTPAGVKLYFFIVSGFDLDQLRPQLVVSLAGSTGPVPSSPQVWQWVEAAPSAIALFVFYGLPAGSYTVTVKLPDGRTASASFTHHP